MARGRTGKWTVTYKVTLQLEYRARPPPSPLSTFYVDTRLWMEGKGCKERQRRADDDRDRAGSAGRPGVAARWLARIMTADRLWDGGR